MGFLLDKTTLQFVQRLAMIVMLGWFLAGQPDNTTAWAFVGAVITDFFHSAKNGNGNGTHGGNS